MTSQLTPRQIFRIGMLYGIYAFIAYAVYFLVMRALGMVTVVELRFLNYIFLAAVTFYACRKAESYKQWRLKYLQAFIVIFLTGAFSFIYFGVFMMAYSLFDPIILDTFADLFQGSTVFGRFSPPFLIASEGISFSSIIALGMAFFVQEYSGLKHKNSGEVLTH
jgi:hypothetical protein